VTGAWEGLVWLRPAWLWALLALPAIAWAWWRARRREQVWRSAVDPALLPHLLERGALRRGHGGLVLRGLAWTLAVLALAGPSWRSVEQPLADGGAPLVLAVELSQSTLAGDLPPSRLLQARARLAELLRLREGQPTALVAYAGDAFTVAPLSDDTGNIALFLDALAPDLMPVDGSDAGRAIDHALRLLARGEPVQGDILLLAATADAGAEAAAARARAAGHRVSVLAMGTRGGMPYRRSDGPLAQAAFDDAALRRVAIAGGGRHVAWGADASAALPGARAAEEAVGRGAGVRARQDGGYWLLLPLMLLVLFAFRRGAALAVLGACLLLPVLPAHAGDEGGLWRRADQARHARLRAGIDAYRAGDDAAALQAWQGLPGATAAYNRGNALARQGRYPEAIAAYDEALRAQPDMEDAIANRRAVEAAMKRQPPGGGNREDSRAQPDEGDQPRGTPEDADEDGPQAEGAGDARSSAQPPPMSSPSDTGEAEPTQDDAQGAADAAQRRAMERARQDRPPPATDADHSGDADPQDAEAAAETDAEREQRQSNDAWLRRIPDDPGGLLRARFRREYERRNGLGDER
jgi:Ca-activated chloride channel homolog